MARSFLAPLRYRFTHPDDVERYGEDWYVYSEHLITHMPGRRLAEIEAELGMPIIDMMNGVRASDSMADLAAAWLGVKMDADRSEKCPPFLEFDAYTMLIDWERVPEDEGKALSPPSAPKRTRTVALPILSAVEQPG
jgi:hypothetical protein